MFGVFLAGKPPRKYAKEVSPSRHPKQKSKAPRNHKLITEMADRQM